MESIKNKTANGVLWSTIERFSVQGIQFIFGIVLARLLEPSDYGLIAMLTIFMAVSQAFIDSGFTNALIRKTNRTDVDYSTVFFFNIFISLIVYVVLFLAAPAIAAFYQVPALVQLTRVYMLSLPIGAFGAIQRTQCIINFEFKSLATASLIGAILSGISGTLFALKGFGVWALVCSYLVNSICTTSIMWIRSSWRPKKIFSLKSLREMFPFGSKLLFSGLLETIYNNLYQFIIGKKFSKHELGFYTRADQFAQFPSSNITGILQRVTYPVLCTLANDDKKLFAAYKRFLRLSAFIIFPLMIGLAIVAQPLIYFLLGEKWQSSAQILQILCLSYIWYPVHAINLNALMVKGRSDLFFRVEIYKKIVGLLILAIVMQFDVHIMAVGTVISSTIALFINTYYTKKLFNYGIVKQMIDLTPIIAISLVSCLPAYLITLRYPQSVTFLIVSIFSAVSSFLLLAKIFKLKELSDVLFYLQKIIHRNGNRAPND